MIHPITPHIPPPIKPPIRENILHNLTLFLQIQSNKSGKNANTHSHHSVLGVTSSISSPI